MLRLLPLVSLTACLGELGGGDDEACDLAANHQTCPECSSGPTTCTFGDTSVTENSCGDCQARGALYQALCDAGETASAEEIEAGTVCEPTVCEVYYDGCADPCEPLCINGADHPETECDQGCTAPIPPPGECTWTGSACEFILVTSTP